MVLVGEILHVATLSRRRLSRENLLFTLFRAPVFSIPKSGDTKLHFEEYFPFQLKQATINQNSLFHKLTSTFPQNPQRVAHIKSTGNQQVTHKVFHREKISESRQDKHFGSCPQFPHPLLLLLLPINNIYYIIFISDKRKMKG